MTRSPDLRHWSPRQWAIASELAFGDWVGSTLVVGIPPDEVLRGTLAHAALAGVLADPPAVARLKRRVARFAPAAIEIVAPSDLATATFTNAIVLEFPLTGAVDFLESVLSTVADGGRILAQVPESHPDARRIGRFLEASAGGEVEAPAWVEPGMQTWLARRRGLVHQEGGDLGTEILPVSAVLYTGNDPPGAEEALASLLRRQNYPPAEVFVLDDAARGEKRLPRDLFGLAAGLDTKVALFPTGGRGPLPALQDALGGVGFPFVSFLTAPCRLAPNFLVASALAAERHPAAVAAVAAGLVAGPDGLPEPSVARSSRAVPWGGDAPLALDQLLFRTAPLRRAGGFVHRKGKGLAPWEDLVRRRPVAGVALPTFYRP